MKFTLIALCGLAVLSFPLTAQETAETIPPAVAKKALEWMQHPEARKRAAAYRTFQLYGDEGASIYRRALEKARELHAKKLATLLENERTNPLAEIEGLSQQITEERERIYALILTDYQKNPAKVSMLQREVESLANLMKRARRLVAKDTKTLDQSVSALGLALTEIRRELATIDGTDSAQPDFKTALEDIYEGEVYLKTQAIAKTLRDEVESLARTKSANEGFAWASAPHQQFAHHLNEARSLFGLTPLLLEEKLCDASVGHSQDMATAGFFAHQSPIEGKTSPTDRARLAGFQHRWTGENIYMGSSSPIAAYNAWFASDGHRFIMFAKGPNLLGIGLHGKHWTMMSGRK